MNWWALRYKLKALCERFTLKKEIQFRTGVEPSAISE